MNQLSWMIYAAGVADELNALMIASAVISCAVSACYTFVHAVEDGTFAIWGKGVITCVTCGILATLIPSSGTIYAIAASEMGEEVIQSSTANKAMQALDKWLDKQIADKGDAK